MTATWIKESDCPNPPDGLYLCVHLCERSGEGGLFFAKYENGEWWSSEYGDCYWQSDNCWVPDWYIQIEAPPGFDWRPAKEPDMLPKSESV